MSPLEYGDHGEQEGDVGESLEMEDRKWVESRPPQQGDGPDPFCGSCQGRGCPNCRAAAAARAARACGLCGRSGFPVADETMRCDRCWELENLVRETPQLALRVLDRLRPMQATGGLWFLAHRGDPCIFCGKGLAAIEPGPCPAGVEEIYRAIGRRTDDANARWEEGDCVDARAAEEDVKRLRLLHEALRDNLLPALQLMGGADGDHR